MLDAPAVMGVQSIDVDHFQIRVVARTLPGKQFDVGRMLRARIAAGLRLEGIQLAANLDTAGPTSADPTSADPTSADPTSADPTSADPTSANPNGTDPNGTD
jgi:small conductance mechanosensitive channel